MVAEVRAQRGAWRVAQHGSGGGEAGLAVDHDAAQRRGIHGPQVASPRDAAAARLELGGRQPARATGKRQARTLRVWPLVRACRSGRAAAAEPAAGLHAIEQNA